MNEPTMREVTLLIESIRVKDRVRHDMGNLDELVNSIREVGLIQPIVITRQNLLMAGERRLRAMQRLGIKELLHAKQFVYNDEVDEVKIKAIEIEENIRRKALSWQEEILAKKRLLEIMQSIHGVARSGYPSRSDTLGITSSGFGVNKLASLLGESNAQTSRDLELAELIESVPELARADTKEAARRTAILGTAVAIAQAASAAKPQPTATDTKWKLYEGDFQQNAHFINDNSVDLVVSDPPFGFGVQGMAANSKELLSKPFEDDLKTTLDSLEKYAIESFRILQNDRFIATFFDIRLYSELKHFLQSAGFTVDDTPLVWVKNNVTNTSPYTRYGRSYELILLARKGEPKLTRTSRRDVISIDNVQTRSVNETKFYQAQKPVSLMSELVLDMSFPDSSIVDFFAGSGSTGEAALRLKRRVVLFEKNLSACSIIKARLGVI